MELTNFFSQSNKEQQLSVFAHSVASERRMKSGRELFLFEKSNVQFSKSVCSVSFTRERESVYLNDQLSLCDTERTDDGSRFT